MIIYILKFSHELEVDRIIGCHASCIFPLFSQNRGYNSIHCTHLALGDLPAERFAIDKFSYAKTDLLASLEKVDTDEDGIVTRPEWRTAQANTWPWIWLWPGGLAAVVLVVFLLGGSDVKPAKEESAESPAEGEEGSSVEESEGEGDAEDAPTGE